jgi:hypothetical protein
VLSDLLASTRARLQLVSTRRSTGGDPRAIVYLEKSSDGFAGYSRAEVTAPLAELPERVAQLLETGASCQSAPWSPTDDKMAPATLTDVLVCGHGSRDRCCGSLGTVLANVAEDIARGASLDVRVWRTTHLGGHRFAPTAVTLPDGMVWGQLDEAAIRAIMLRDQPANEVTRCSRGNSGLPPRAQLLDTALLAVYGWDWLQRARVADVRDDSRVRLRAPRDDGGFDEWEGFVAVRRELPVPVCGVPLDGSEKRESELVLEAYRALSHSGAATQRERESC